MWSVKRKRLSVVLLRKGSKGYHRFSSINNMVLERNGENVCIIALERIKYVSVIKGIRWLGSDSLWEIMWKNSFLSLALKRQRWCLARECT